MTTQEPHQSGQVTRVTVTRGRSGWEVREERDSQVVRRAHYTDWHRVERAIQCAEGAAIDAAGPGHEA